MDRTESDSQNQGEQLGSVPAFVQSRLENEVLKASRSESWIELSSQPSTSSMSSSINDDIVTTGLKIQRKQKQSQDPSPIPNQRRRQRRKGAVSGTQTVPGTGSSQEEYDESESEEDSNMNSSAENIVSVPLTGVGLVSRSYSHSDEADDDDEVQTAIGVPQSRNAFVPQPNLFSHRPDITSEHSSPLLHQGQRRQSIPRAHSHGEYNRERWNMSHSPINFASSAYQADQDAALRASLSTLLSCAAAARGLPKQNRAQHPASRQSTETSAQSTAPRGLQLLSESDLLRRDSALEEEAATTSAATERTRSNEHLQLDTRPQLETRPSDSSASSPIIKNKRKNNSSAGPRVKDWSNKKARAVMAMADSSSLEPQTSALLTWTVYTGMFVFVSAISFSAGYVMGRDIGYAEAQALAADTSMNSATCGTEFVKNSLRDGLRRLRWTSGASSGAMV
jgi:hypothetical protein